MWTLLSLTLNFKKLDYYLITTSGQTVQSIPKVLFLVSYCKYFWPKFVTSCLRSWRWAGARWLSSGGPRRPWPSWGGRFLQLRPVCKVDFTIIRIISLRLKCLNNLKRLSHKHLLRLVQATAILLQPATSTVQFSKNKNFPIKCNTLPQSVVAAESLVWTTR